MNSAREARTSILNGVARRKFARQVPVPIDYEGVTYHLRQPSLEEATTLATMAGGERIKLAALVIEQFLYFYQERVFERGDHAILLTDNPNQLVAVCLPVIDKMLSTAPIPGKSPGPHPGLDEAIDLSMELASGHCRRCEVPVDKACPHRPAKKLHRCGNEGCEYYVRKRGDLCAIHRSDKP